MVDPYVNPDAKWRKSAKSYRRKRGFPIHLLAVAAALIVLGGGFVYWLTLPPDAAAALETILPEFLSDWNSLDATALRLKWSEDENDRTRAKFVRLFASKGWDEKRPPLDLVTIEGSKSGRGGRTDFHPRGLPKEALVKVYWIERYGHWRATRVTLVQIPAAR
jgi:hypothetical protein